MSSTEQEPEFKHANPSKMAVFSPKDKSIKEIEN